MVKRSGGVSLQGPRPQPLSLPSAAARPSKRPRGDDGGGAPGPVIVYEHTPKVIHVRPDEFKALVQRLTGLQHPVETAAAAASPQEDAATTAATDPLVLTLGKQQAPPLLHHDDDHHYTTAALVPNSPGGGLASADFLFSPGSFLFSPTTMQQLIS